MLVHDCCDFCELILRFFFMIGQRTAQRRNHIFQFIAWRDKDAERCSAEFQLFFIVDVINAIIDEHGLFVFFFCVAPAVIFGHNDRMHGRRIGLKRALPDFDHLKYPPVFLALFSLT